jgi:hypothetical protein
MREIRIYAAQLLFQNGNDFNLDQEIFAGWRVTMSEKRESADSPMRKCVYGTA